MVLTLIQPSPKTQYATLYQLTHSKKGVEWVKVKSGIIYELEDTRLKRVIAAIADHPDHFLFLGIPGKDHPIKFDSQYIERCKIESVNIIPDAKAIDMSAFWRKMDSSERAIKEREELKAQSEENKRLEKLKRKDPIAYLAQLRKN
jgi:hypothetical protein